MQPATTPTEKTVKDSVQSQFGPVAHRYAQSGVHSGGVDLDLLVNSVSVTLLRNVTVEPSETVRFKNEGPVTSDILAGHTTSPTTVDWDGDGTRDLLIGAEDGFLYYMQNPTSEGSAPR